MMIYMLKLKIKKTLKKNKTVSKEEEEEEEKRRRIVRNSGSSIGEIGFPKGEYRSAIDGPIPPGGTDKRCNLC